MQASNRLSALALCLGALSFSACNQGPRGANGEVLADLQTWATTYGGTGTQRVRDIQQTADDGFIAVGETEHFGPGETDAWVMKQDKDGNVLWSRAIGDANLLLTGNAGMNWGANEALDSNQIEVKAIADGGCIAVGGVFQGNMSGTDNEFGPVWKPAAVRMDADGNVLWRRVYEGGDRGGRALDVASVGSGGWAIAGYVENVGTNLDRRNRDLLIMKIDADGNEEWREVYGGIQHEVATCILVEPGALPGDAPSAIVVAGVKGRAGGERGNEGFLFKIAYSDHAILIDQTFLAREGINVFDIEEDPFRPSYVVSGAVKDDRNDHYNSGTANRFDGIVISFRSNDGAEEWSRVIEMAPIFDNAPDYSFALTRVATGGWYAAGFGGVLSRDAALVKLDDDGELVPEDTRSYGDDAVQEEFHDVKRTRNGYIAVGYKGDQAWVVRIGANLHTRWETTFDLPGGASRAYSVTPTHEFGADTGYLVAGAGAAGGWLIKLSPEGSESWRKTIHDRNNEIAWGVRQTDDDGDGQRDDGYIVVGTNESISRTSKDSWVIKLDADGAFEWQDIIGGAFDDDTVCLELTSDGGLVVAGGTRTPAGNGSTPGDWDSWIYKVPLRGGNGWLRTFNETGTDGWERVNCVREAADGSLILAGEGYGGAFVQKLDRNGNADSTWTSPTVVRDRIACSVQPTSDGSYVVVGYVPYFDATDDLWLAKVDAGGAVVAQARLSGPSGGDSEERAHDVVETATGYAVAGYTRSFGAGNLCENEQGHTVMCANIWVVHLRHDLSIEWERTYATPTEDMAYAITVTRDGNLVVAGETDTSFLNTEDTGPRGIDGFILRMRADGTISASCDDQMGMPSAATVWRGEPTPFERAHESRFGYALDLFDDYEVRPQDDIGRMIVDTLCFDQTRQVTLRIDIIGQGRVTDDESGIDCVQTCSVSLPEGTVVNLSAIADPGWEFAGFDDDCPDGVIRMDRDVVCEVTFTGGEEPEEGGFAGYWNIEYARTGFCGEVQMNESGTEQVLIELNGTQATIDNFTIGQIYQGTLAGNVLSWSVTYDTPRGSMTEAGTYTLSPNGTGFTKSADYTLTPNGGPQCTGICTGSATKL